MENIVCVVVVLKFHKISGIHMISREMRKHHLKSLIISQSVAYLQNQ